MDSLTQIVLGASVGEAVLGKKIGNKAILYGAIAGTIPDLDVLANYFTDALTAIEIHRGFTHSFVFALFFAPLLAWLVSKVEKRSEATYREWWLLFFLGFVTHALLDAMTTWGTQLFWPIHFPVAIQNIFVIDPLYTLPFLGLVILTMFQKRTSPKRASYNRLALIISSSYLLLTLLIKSVVYFSFTSALDQQAISYSAMKTKPAPLNVILWNANIMSEEVIYLADYSLLDSQPIRFYPVPKNHHLLGDLIHDKNVQRLIKITEGWFTVEQEGDMLYLNDLRFGLLNNNMANPQFAFSYQLIPTQETIHIAENRKTREDARLLLRQLWQRIKGN